MWASLAGPVSRFGSSPPDRDPSNTDAVCIVSAGFGLDKWPEHTASNNLHRIIFDHLNDLFPASNGVTLDESGRASKSNGFINGALGGTGELALVLSW